MTADAVGLPTESLERCIMKVEQGIPLSNFQRPVNLIEIAQRGKPQATRNSAGTSFKDMFSAELAQNRGLSFSRHAQQRLFSRGIELSDDTLGRIADAVDRAATKGSKETLVMSDEVAMVVSVTNRTVITAFDRDNLREGVVTSIDSAVIL